MKALVLNRFGDTRVFEKVEIATPEAAAGEVVIEVKATSVNPVDWKMRNGEARFLVGALPAILHPDCSGVISKVGAGVADFSEGDEVFCFATGMMGKPGALAEYMAADARLVAKKPMGMSFEDAAAMPLVWTTACFALLERNTLKPGGRLLVQGGTGGVGSVAVQLAAAMLDVEVYATCGTDEKCRVAEQLGAAKAFNYNDLDPSEIAAQFSDGAGFDTVFNTPGAASIDASVAVAGFGATIIDINGAFPSHPEVFQYQQMVFSCINGGHAITHDIDQTKVGKFLRLLGDLFESGKVKPVLDPRRFTFANIGEAHDYQQTCSPIGKVVVAAKWD